MNKEEELMLLKCVENNTESIMNLLERIKILEETLK